MPIEVKKTFYKSGNIKTEIPYVNNKKTGRAKLFYENGNIKTETDYCDGIIDGYVRTYYEDGSLESVETYKNGERNHDLVYTIEMVMLHTAIVIMAIIMKMFVAVYIDIFKKDKLSNI